MFKALFTRISLWKFSFIFIWKKKKIPMTYARDGDVFSCAMKFSWYICSNYLVHLVFNLFYMPERRQAEAARIREKYPDRIPVRIFIFFVVSVFVFLLNFKCWCMYCCMQVIVERAEKSDIPDIDKKKLVLSWLLLGLCKSSSRIGSSFYLLFQALFIIVKLLMSSIYQFCMMSRHFHAKIIVLF